MEVEVLKAVLEVVRDGGPLGIALVFGYALYNLFQKLDARIDNLINKLIDGTKEYQVSCTKTATAMASIQEDMREVRQAIVAKK